MISPDDNLLPSSSFVQGSPGEGGPPGPSGSRVSISCIFLTHGKNCSSGHLKLVVTNTSLLSFRATEVSLVSVVLLALLAQLDPVVLLALVVATEPR